MEDRNTPGLYLEMTTQAPEAYEEQRVPRLLAQAGVQRATWWENVVPDRTDLPRELDEFSLLGLYEVDDTFRAPDAAAETSSHHFRRYPRPAQGCLSGRPTIGLSLVLISPRRPEEAQALRDWADFVHIRHIAETGNRNLEGDALAGSLLAEAAARSAATLAQMNASMLSRHAIADAHLERLRPALAKATRARERAVTAYTHV